jgi:hypothetical protein
MGTEQESKRELAGKKFKTDIMTRGQEGTKDSLYSAPGQVT